MMDPLSAISLADSVVGIVDVVSRTIKSLHNLSEPWKEADLAVTLLIAQLSALKAALNQISEWVSSDLSEHLIITSLSLTLMLDWNYDNALDYESRIRVVLEDKAIEKCLNQLNNQTHALNLVLTAFSWLVCRLASDCIGRHTDLISRTHSEQKELRERETSRQVFDQVKDDSSLLVVLRDSASFLSSCTKTTENSSKLSMRFMFDGELLQSRVYQGTVRSLLRRAIRGGREINAGSSVSITPHKLSKEEKDKAARSSQIDSLIDKDAKRLRREVKVWVLGAPRSGESTICKTIKAGYDGPDMYGARNIVRNALSDRLIIPVVIFKYK